MPLLDNLSFEQGGKCFFCERIVPKKDRSVEHILAKSLGGGSDRGNTVMCCKKFNQLLANRTLKEKFHIVLVQNGKMKCPDQ